jgi:hypothetical protein
MEADTVNLCHLELQTTETAIRRNRVNQRENYSNWPGSIEDRGILCAIGNTCNPKLLRLESKSPMVTLYTEGFSRFYLHECSDCFRLERQGPRRGRTRWKAVPLHGARE